jgi:MoaA/NifB/PqqE/SkfB family radical SAM enzyme
MLSGIHILLTYKCLYECDHCFVYSSPKAEGTFTLAGLKNVIDEAVKIGTIEWIYFEGGEPTLYYPLLIEGIKYATEKGFKTGIVTNAYFASTEEDAELWLKPLADLNIQDLSISNDAFHSGDPENSPAAMALKAAEKLGLPTGSISIDEPYIVCDVAPGKAGKPIVGGGVMFRGRAAEKLTEGLPRKNWEEFDLCPWETLAEPERVHVDAYGFVHLCQGISMGNMNEVPLNEIIKNYNPLDHPIASALINGGPAALAKRSGTVHELTYVDACHLCFDVRKKMLNERSLYLAPRQVYGL